MTDLAPFLTISNAIQDIVEAVQIGGPALPVSDRARLEATLRRVRVARTELSACCDEQRKRHSREAFPRRFGAWCRCCLRYRTANTREEETLWNGR